MLSVSAVLLLTGTLLLKATEDVTWLGAFFQSVSARTAGFSTYPIGSFTNAGLFVLILLMFIGASPGSTGGGIKTSTLFVLLHAVKSAATNQHCTAFKKKDTTGSDPKRIYHYTAVSDGGLYRHLFPVSAGTGIYIYAVAV